MNKDKLQPMIEFELGGKNLKLEFNMWAISQFEELTGIDLLSKKSAAKGADISKLLWAGLITHQPELDGFFINGKPSIEILSGLRTCGKLVGLSDLPVITAKISDALERSKNPGETSGKNEEREAVPA